jgi:hypothetical protein
MRTSTRRRVYLREAVIALVLARLALRLFSSARVFAWADRPPRRIRRFAADEAGWVAWAVESLGARKSALCLPRALAAHTMLRHRGIASRLCLGVARRDGVLGAHAWVEVGGDKIVGAAEAEGFTPLAAYGAAKG